MFAAIRKLFARETAPDPRAVENARMLALVQKETTETARYARMERADINALLRAVKPDHPQGHVGPAPLKPGMKPQQTWLRAEPVFGKDNPEPLFRIQMCNAPDGRNGSRTHIVCVSSGRMTRADVAALFALWDEEGARIAALPPDPAPEAKKDAPPPSPAP